METLTIDLPTEVARQLRDEAQRRNVSVQSVVVRWLFEHLQQDRSVSESEVGANELDVVRQAIDDVRSSAQQR